MSTHESSHEQGGILAGSQGARLPRNLQTHTKFCQHFTLFWRKFDFKVYISCQVKKFLLSHTTCRKYFLSSGRNSLALEVIKCHRKKFIERKESFIKGRNFLSQEKISCHRKIFLVIGRNFLSEVDMSFHRKKFLSIRRNFLSKKETCCHGKEFHAIVRHFLSQEEISCHRKKFLVTV